MSYDITVLDEEFNYTSNMGRFFMDFGVYPPDWTGKPRAAVGASIRSALESIRANRIETLKTEYDAPNGWGSAETAIDFLERVAAACEKPRPAYSDEVSVS